MTEIPFTYEEFEQTRTRLINDVNSLMTVKDKKFLIKFECAEPDWNDFEFPYFQNFPSVRWKLINLQRLKTHNPVKLTTEAQKLREIFNM